MPSKKKRQPVPRKAVQETDPLLLISRILLSSTAVALLYLFLHLHWKFL
ncbi:MAG: hypothetical protein JW863_00670 [Chitinispirillaceae bacterium]|nr:hypothetical protein [Chitinispirillaceae bacterium]